MTKRHSLPESDVLHQAFRYEEETGHIFCRLGHRWKWKDGPILSRSTCGYLTVSLEDVTYYQHRVIWKMVTGDEPPEFIDHINQDRTDNRWGNLREADLITNSWNSKPRRHNKTGYRGVTFHKAQGVWQANIKFDGVRHYLGHFQTAEEAAAAFDAVAVEVSRGFYTPQTVIKRPGAAR